MREMKEMKAASLIILMAVTALLAGCSAEPVQETAVSPSVEADDIGNEINSEDLDMSDLDSLDQDLESIDADLEDF